MILKFQDFISGHLYQNKTTQQTQTWLHLGNFFRTPEHLSILVIANTFVIHQNHILDEFAQSLNIVCMDAAKLLVW